VKKGQAAEERSIASSDWKGCQQLDKPKSTNLHVVEKLTAKGLERFDRMEDRTRGGNGVIMLGIELTGKTLAENGPFLVAGHGKYSGKQRDSPSLKWRHATV